MNLVETISPPSDENINSTSGGLAFETGNNRIIGRDQNSIPRLIIKADGEEFDMKVSKSNIDVLTATDAGLIFNSNQNVFKIVDSGTTTIPGFTIGAGVANGFSTIGVPVTNPYSSVLAFMVDSYGNRSPIPGFRVFIGFNSTGSGTPQVMPLNQYVTYNSTATSIDFTNYATNPDASVFTYTATAVNIKYYILQESAV